MSVKSEAKEKMQKALQHSFDEFSAIRTGRANPALVEKIYVEYYGSKVPLQQLASISVPEARVLLISPFDKSAIVEIEKSIQSSDLGINPGNDGNVIRCVFPQLTEDRRKDLVKLAKSKAEESKVSIRNVRRNSRQKIDELKTSGEISDDEVSRLEKEVDTLTNEFIAEIDVAATKKEAELMEV